MKFDFPSLTEETEGLPHGKIDSGYSEYMSILHAIMQQAYTFEVLHKQMPAALYVTADLLSILQRGPSVTNRPSGPVTLWGIPVRTCSGCGLEFHFATEIINIGEPIPTTKKRRKTNEQRNES